MITADIRTAPRREVDGLVSHVLLGEGAGAEAGASALAVTWVEVAPGACQAAHAHPPEQVYVILSGHGRMRVGAEERDLGPGDLALIPPGETHGITNIGTVTLVYVSAATPSFRVTDLYDGGALSD